MKNFKKKKYLIKFFGIEMFLSIYQQLKNFILIYITAIYFF